MLGQCFAAQVCEPSARLNHGVLMACTAAQVDGAYWPGCLAISRRSSRNFSFSSVALLLPMRISSF